MKNNYLVTDGTKEQMHQYIICNTSLPIPTHIYLYCIQVKVLEFFFHYSLLVGKTNYPKHTHRELYHENFGPFRRLNHSLDLHFAVIRSIKLNSIQIFNNAYSMKNKCPQHSTHPVAPWGFVDQMCGTPVR